MRDCASQTGITETAQCALPPSGRSQRTAVTQSQHLTETSQYVKRDAIPKPQQSSERKVAPAVHDAHAGLGAA